MVVATGVSASIPVGGLIRREYLLVSLSTLYPAHLGEPIDWLSKRKISPPACTISRATCSATTVTVVCPLKKTKWWRILYRQFCRQAGSQTYRRGLRAGPCGAAVIFVHRPHYLYMIEEMVVELRVRLISRLDSIPLGGMLKNEKG